MVETVAILVILGILASVAVSRGVTTQQNLLSETDTFKTHLRFAQLKALHDTAHWGITLTGSAYTLYRNPALASPINLPGENSTTHTFQGGVSGPNVTVDFDSWGSPGAVDIALSFNDGTNFKTITVTNNTGYMLP